MSAMRPIPQPQPQVVNFFFNSEKIAVVSTQIESLFAKVIAGACLCYIAHHAIDSATDLICAKYNWQRGTTAKVCAEFASKVIKACAVGVCIYGTVRSILPTLNAK